MMAAALVFVVLFAGGGVLLWSRLVGYFARGPLEKLRDQYNGTLVGPNLGKAGPVLRFAHREHRVYLGVTPLSFMRWRPVLMVGLVFRPVRPPLTSLRLEVQSRSRFAVAPRELTELVTGDGELDQALLVSGDPADVLRQLMGEGLRTRLVELFQLSTNLDVFRLSFSAQTLVIERSVEVRWDPEWMGWVFPLVDRVGWGILEMLTGKLAENTAPSLGELQITMEPAHAEEAPGCLVCAQPITSGRQAFCTTCETPHHLDCWLYNERCALFGCGGERYRERVLVVPPRLE
jgi:hypothetical protein